MKKQMCMQCESVLPVWHEGMSGIYASSLLFIPYGQNRDTPGNSVSWEPNAFSEEIHGDKTCYWLCYMCQYENGMDV